MRKKSTFWISIFLCLVIFASAGICAGLLGERFGLKLDLTEQKLYTLSSETKRVLDGLDEEVTLTVLDQRADFPAIVANLLDSYCGACPELKVVYADPFREPQVVRALDEKGLKAAEGNIAVASGDAVKLLAVENLYQLDESGGSVVRLMAEQQITSAIDAVRSPEKGPVLFTDGHGESPSKALMALFEMNHYTPAYGELSVTGIPEDTALIVICAPSRDASGQEIALLEEFLARGGAVLMFMEPGSGTLLNFADFLADRGIGLTDDVVREPSLCLSGNELNIVATYAPHEITEYFSGHRVYPVMPSGSEVEQLYVKQGRTKTQIVLRTSADAYTMGGETGSRPLCVSSSRTDTDEDGEQTEQRLVVFGSGLIYGDDLLGEEKLANSELLVQTISWLDGDEELLNIPVKNLDADILPATAQTVRRYTAVMVVGVPVLILLAGAAMYIKRRYL